MFMVVVYVVSHHGGGERCSSAIHWHIIVSESDRRILEAWALLVIKWPFIRLHIRMCVGTGTARYHPK